MQRMCKALEFCSTPTKLAVSLLSSYSSCKNKDELTETHLPCIWYMVIVTSEVLEWTYMNERIT